MGFGELVGGFFAVFAVGGGGWDGVFAVALTRGIADFAFTGRRTCVFTTALTLTAIALACGIAAAFATTMLTSTLTIFGVFAAGGAAAYFGVGAPGLEGSGGGG